MIGATVLTLFAAAAGAFTAVRRAVRVPPAEAMRPEAPAGYRRSVFETPLISRHLGAAGRMVLRNVTRHPLRTAASMFGIGFAVAILMIGFVFSDAIDRLIETQFFLAERQDVTVGFVEPRADDARHALARLPGVVSVEPQRSVAVRVRSGHHQRYLSLTGVPPDPRFRLIVDRDGKALRMPASGVVLSQILADVLGVALGDTVTVEVLEGARPVRQVEVAGLVDDTMGLAMYMELAAVHRLMREGDVASGALLLIDPAQQAALSRALKLLPAVAGAGFKRAVLQSFRETMAANMNLSILINLIFAGVIACGVVYNAARVSLSERSRELASLRVLGFTRAEISLILLGELALLTLAALPVGAILGYGLSALIVGTIQSEVYRFPLYVSRQAVAWAFLGIIAAAVGSALVVRRQLDSARSRGGVESEGVASGGPAHRLVVMRMLKNTRLLAVVGIVALILAAALWPRSVEVEAVPVARGPMQVTLDEEGETRVRERFVVSAPVMGRVERIELEPGDAVVRNKTVVVRLTPAAAPLINPRSEAELSAAAEAARAAVGQARAERERASTALARAQTTARRLETLLKSGAVSGDELEAAQTALKTAEEAVRAADFAVARAEHELQLARARLKPSSGGGGTVTLVAPVDGVVLKRLRESASVVPVGEPLLEIGDPATLEIVADFLSTDAVRISPGHSVVIDQWGGSQPLEGQVRRVEPSGFMKVSALGVEEQRVNVIIDLADDRESPRLGDGYRVEVRVIVWRDDRALQVPVGSLFRRGEEWAAFVIDGDRVRLQRVVLGQRNDREAQVLEGLSEGQRVVLHPRDTLIDGARVTVRPRAGQ